MSADRTRPGLGARVAGGALIALGIPLLLLPGPGLLLIGAGLGLLGWGRSRERRSGSPGERPGRTP